MTRPMVPSLKQQRDWQATGGPAGRPEEATADSAGRAWTGTCIAAEPFALQILDDSMEPEFACGCVVVVDPSGRIGDGAFVLAELPDAYVVRQLHHRDGECRLRALNADYPDLLCETALSSIRGVVVQRAGPRRKDRKRYD